MKFHPLSLRVLAQQLKTRRPAELGERLEELCSRGRQSAPTPAGEDQRRLTSAATELEDTPAGLLASLELSLDTLDATARQVLPRLGVFQGGAMEDDLVAITGLGESGAAPRSRGRQSAPTSGGEDQRRLTSAATDTPEANLWPALRRQLAAAALLEAEEIPGVSVPFLRFHPTLAPLLWAQLAAAARTQWSAAHRQRYHALSGYLYHEDVRNPHQARAIAWRELPNLLHAVHAALDAGEPDAGDFADKVNRFLGPIFGLKQEATRLAAKAQAAAGEAGSRAWVLAQSNRGEQLLEAGQVAEAAQVFQAILAQLGDAPRYQRAVTLGNFGRCYRAGGRSDLAVQAADGAIAVCDQLEPSDSVKRHRGVLLTDKANALAEQGKYAEARKAYEDGLKVDEELHDLRGQGVTLGQLGTLAMEEGNLPEAAERYRTALALFQRLREPAMEAVGWHQLGRVFQEARQWDEAERHYRESARIKEERGDLAGAARTWNQLAIVNKSAGKPDAAERWYRKAIEVDRAIGNPKELAPDLSNLANLLRTQPGRLAEARQLAEEALAISQTLDPGAAQIWSTYTILAEIAEQEEFGVPPSGGGASAPSIGSGLSSVLPPKGQCR